MTECISEGLYRIPVPLPGNPLRELNSYLLRGRERSLLIDTGFRQEEGRRALFAGLAELDVDPRDVDVALTHLHSDHSGLAPEVVGETGWIYVSGPDRAYLEQPEEAKWAHTDAFYISEGFPPELLAQNRANPARALAPVPTGRYRTLEPGAVLEAGGRRLTCLPAPGHTPGQLCFWDESDGILFTGDHVLFDISPNITPWNGMEDALGCYLDSLRAVRELPARLALPGHRRPGALAPRVDALLEHHARRLDELTAIRESSDGQLLVFYRFKDELERMRARFGSDLHEVHEPDIVARWNRGEVPMLAAHPLSAKFGLNLQEGGHEVVWTTLPWSLDDYSQANARLNRSGQRDTVVVHRLVERGTVDERILDVLAERASLHDSVMAALRRP